MVFIQTPDQLEDHQLLVGASPESGCQSTVGISQNPVPLQEGVRTAHRQPTHDCPDFRIVNEVPGRGQTEVDAHPLIARDIGDIGPLLPVHGALKRPMLILAQHERGRPRGIDRKRAAGQRIVARHIEQNPDAMQGCTDVVERLRRLRDGIAIRFRRKVVPGPDRGIATTRVAHNFVAIRRSIHWIQNARMRKVSLTDAFVDTQGIRFGRKQKHRHETNQTRHAFRMP